MGHAHSLSVIYIDSFYYLTFESIACDGSLFLAKAMRQKTFEQQYSVVADNFECLLRSRSKTIALRPIASSIMNVCRVNIFRPHKVLYPAEKLLSVVNVMDDGHFNLSRMSWDEKPSAGFQFYSPNFRYWPCGDLSRIDTYYEDESFNADQMRKLIEGGPQSFVFWDRERMFQIWVVNV